MTREIDLVSYLPPFLAEFKEIAVTLEAENPEFVLVWNAAERVLKNEFIETADEYGISRFEKLLHIFPSTEDTLESRRARVQIRWFSSIPYTWRVFIERLIAICGENNFTLTKHFIDGYLLELEVSLELYGQIEELERLIETMFPCNIAFIAENSIPCYTEALPFGAVACVPWKPFLSQMMKRSFKQSKVFPLSLVVLRMWLCFRLSQMIVRNIFLPAEQQLSEAVQ